MVSSAKIVAAAEGIIASLPSDLTGPQQVCVLQVAEALARMRMFDQEDMAAKEESEKTVADFNAKIDKALKPFKGGEHSNG